LPQARGRCSRGVFCTVYCSQAAAFRDSRIPQIYTPGERLEHTAAIRLRQIWKSRLKRSSLFVNEPSTTTHPALAPLSHLHPDTAYANPMTSVTSSLALMARLPLCPPQYPYDRRSSASSLTLIRTLSHSSCCQARPSRQHGTLLSHSHRTEEKLTLATPEREPLS
jgi:hypothetical protein